MSEERLSEEHMALLERALGNVENDYRPTCESVNYGSGCPGATAASIDFWRRAVDAMPILLAEVRHLRAALPSAEEREALRNVGAALEETYRSKCLDAMINGEDAPTRVRLDLALAALARLVEERGA